VIDSFWKKSLFFRDTTDHQELDAKTRLSIPITSFENTLAEVVSVKKTDLSFLVTSRATGRSNPI